MFKFACTRSRSEDARLELKRQGEKHSKHRQKISSFSSFSSFSSARVRLGYLLSGEGGGMRFAG
jgi:hypothetical protein